MRNAVGERLEFADGFAQGTGAFSHCAFEFFLLPFAFGNVVKNYSNLAKLRRSDAESKNVIPVVQSGGTIFKPKGFTGESDSAIDVEPVLLVLGSQFTHALTGGVDETGLFRKRRVRFDEVIVH